jgi:hypothetical protein
MKQLARHLPSALVCGLALAGCTTLPAGPSTEGGNFHIVLVGVSSPAAVVTVNGREVFRGPVSVRDHSTGLSEMLDVDVGHHAQVAVCLEENCTETRVSWTDGDRFLYVHDWPTLDMSVSRVDTLLLE